LCGAIKIFPFQESGMSSRDKERLRDEYEERAAILEYDAGLPRWRAEAIARRMVYGQRTSKSQAAE